ncbi:MAG TPA: hypothetical protein DDZ83_10380 [Nitrospinae bacterium]|nr:hypothetical protein [Nitrospinota bacterium]
MPLKRAGKRPSKPRIARKQDECSRREMKCHRPGMSAPRILAGPALGAPICAKMVQAVDKTGTLGFRGRSWFL